MYVLPPKEVIDILPSTLTRGPEDQAPAFVPAAEAMLVSVGQSTRAMREEPWNIAKERTLARAEPKHDALVGLRHAARGSRRRDTGGRWGTGGVRRSEHQRKTEQPAGSVRAHIHSHARAIPDVRSPGRVRCGHSYHFQQ